MTDHELLDSFVSRQDQAAFAELVRRHVDLVYNACLRQTRGCRDLADDATQVVFFLLARRGGRISKRVVIAGWLYTTARHAAANAMRAERRRRHHERQAGMNMPMTSLPPHDASREPSPWQRAAPILDDALNTLAPRDRDALLLRYFRGLSTGEVAVELAVSEEAARQRLSRAVDKLRRAFARRGMAVTTAGVATVFATMDASPAPAAVATASIATAGAGIGGAGGVLAWVADLARDTLYTSRFKPLLKTVGSGGAVIATAVVTTVLVANQPAVPPVRPVAASHPAATTAPATRPVATSAPAPVDAPALVREVRAAEQWIETVKSMRVKAETSWHAPPGAAAIPAQPQSIVAGFDDHRLYYRADAPEYQLIDHRTWDGTVAVFHSKYDHAHRDQEQYVLDVSPERVGDMQFVNFAWPRATPHTFWWGRSHLPIERYGGEPEDFRLAARETFRGTDCYVLESDLSYNTLYVGVADHRLYGMARRTLPRTSQNSSGPVGREVANDMGANLKDGRGLTEWLIRLPEADKSAYKKEFHRRMRPFSRPDATYWFADYRELAKGCWYPMRQGYDNWNSEADPLSDPAVTSQREVRITEAVVNTPLPDAWFVWTFDEGVELYDMRDDRKLHYKYKKHFEPAEWQAILDDASERKARMRPGAENIRFQRQRTDALGKPAPAFPANATWINSPPLKMADLKGKVVIVECFASWSKFSLDELSNVIDLHEHGKDGIVVIGVHAPGTPAEDVRKWVKEHGVTFPVCIDTPVGKGPWEGGLFNAYHVMQVPNAYVIDRTGRVTSEGTPGGAVTYGARVSTRPTKRP